MPHKIDFFISYNQADREWAEWIAWCLEEDGYTTILQAWDFPPGTNFVTKMRHAVAGSERILAVLSKHYTAAKFTQPEWQEAFAEDPTGEKGTLVPVRVGHCDRVPFLGQVIYIDLIGLEEDAARRALLQGVKQDVRTKPAGKPAFPGQVQRSMPERPRFPARVPPIWNVPHARNVNFTGREELLAELEEDLKAGRTAALTQTQSRPQAVTGLGGVGKTQTALEYVYRHMGGYSLVWWIRSEDPSTLTADYAALAKDLDLGLDVQRDRALICAAVRNRLGQNPGWLLVFDNAGEPEDLHDYLPQAATGHVIITSRNPVWRSMAALRLVDTLPIEQAIEFLLKRTGREDEAAALELAEALGRLPLALEQAGAYMEATSVSFAHYLKIFQERPQELMEKGPTRPDYPATVARTWDLSFHAVKEASPAAADMLNLFAFLAPEAIPVDLLTEGAEHLPEPLAETIKDPIKFDEAKAALRRYSLVEVQAGEFSVHRLVQVVTRDRLGADEGQEWAGVAVRLLNEAFPFSENDLETWPRSGKLLPHALEAAVYADKMAAALETTGHLLTQCGQYLRTIAQFERARRAFERALEIHEACFGPDHPDVATLLNNLGSVLWDLGDPAGARENLERALEMDEKSLSPDHPNVAIRLNNLGLVLKALGDPAGAKRNYERALEIDETRFGPKHPHVATDLNNLGLVLKDLGDLAGAREKIERALVIGEKTLGKDHPNVATSLNNLGSVLLALGDPAGAKRNYLRALEIDEARFGPEHPEVAADLNNLGMVLRDLDDLAGAREKIERALAIGEKTLGADHPEVATRLNNLGLVLKDLGDPAGAKRNLKRALAILGKVYGEEHHLTQLVLKNLESLER